MKRLSRKRNKKMKMRGGTGCNHTFVGKPWGPPVSSWPGVSGTHNGDHIAYNSFKTSDPYTGYVMSERDGSVYPPMMNGGFTYNEKNTYDPKKMSKSIKRLKTSKNKGNTRKYLRGGGSFPLLGDAHIMGSRISTGITNTFYNKLFGHPQSVSSLPWEGQFGYK